MCVRSPRPYAVGHHLAIQIALGGEYLELQGVVTWTNPSEQVHGVHFVDVPPEAEARLEAVVWLLTGLAA